MIDYRVETAFREKEDRKNVAVAIVGIVRVRGNISDKSDCLTEFREAYEKVARRKDLTGLVINLKHCSWISEEGFGVIGQIIKSHENVVFVLGDEHSQPIQKFNIMKLDTITECRAEEDAAFEVAIHAKPLY